MGRHLKLENKKIGKLTIVKIIGKDKNGRYLWLCKCECGGEIVLKTKVIHGERVTSCGCERMLHNRLNNRKFAIMKSLYSSSIIKRNKKWNEVNHISIDEFEQLSNDNCFYCGCIPSQRINDWTRLQYRSDEFILVNGVDRIDSNKGYIEGNVRSCCTDCNVGKNALTEDEFKSHIKKIYNNFIIKLGGIVATPLIK